MKYINIFKKYNIELSERQYEMFKKYYKMLIDENMKYNLTAITEEDDVWMKHFLDSVLTCSIFENNCSVLDIGGGAGFPSIPLKIVRPDLNITVMDSVKKKTNFMQMVVDELKLEGINIVHSRCEDLANNSSYRQSYDYVIGRAVAPLTTLLEYTIPFAKVKGKLVLYKGDKYIEEIKNSQNTCKLLSCELEKIKDVYIEEYGYKRYFLIYTKKSNTDKKYPRGQNKPRIMPLN